MKAEKTTVEMKLQFTKETILEDYRTAFRSRQASLLGRREVLTGKAKFGIFGDGKEVAQVAMARAFRKGDFRSGYYRDQTFMFATGMSNLDEFFAQLYAIADIESDPSSAGRSMNCHFGSRSLDENGAWRRLAEMYNSSSDISPTGSQMPRLVGLAYASKLFRNVPELAGLSGFSQNGDEIAFGTIGNASCAEGMFWESINAAGVMQIPMLVSVWDDGYGISVPNEFQVAKGNISELLAGFQRRDGEKNGYDIYSVRGWDYPSLCETYINAASIVRMEHVPSIIHVIEVTQPQGHSTSGSHERYKSKERLQWEEEFDCIRKMRQWIVEQGIATSAELDVLESEDKKVVIESQRRVWQAYREPINVEFQQLSAIAEKLEAQSTKKNEVRRILGDLQRTQNPYRRDLVRAAEDLLILVRDEAAGVRSELAEWKKKMQSEGDERYDSDLYSETPHAALRVEPVAPEYADDSPVLNGFEIINACFDEALAKYPQLSIMGEDVGQLGDVNQGCAGLQEKFGLYRVSDTGIRECTILGEAIGMASRGLRPIAEIQYLDYVLYALQIMSDDLATLRWRTKGGQAAPVIVRTRGHRLEGIWHSGSPMAGLLNLVRGMYLCVPRNMTQAAGFYNTLLASDDPAIVIEVLNGYRAKEKRPKNVGEFRIPLGVPEILREGSDITVVSYGATLRIVAEAAELLERAGISIELIDVQTLLPFDLGGIIAKSVEKTNRVVFVDEDVPGGATAFMMQNVLERDRAYEWLDSAPLTIAAKAHRPAYGSDGDYWSKPNRETIFEGIYRLMHDAAPAKYPLFF